jgi:predicted metal-dependent peptidase
MKQDNTPEFSRAVSRLTLTNIFFTALLYSLKIERDDTLPFSACTDGVTLKYSGPWFAKFDTTEAVFTLAHELGHVILMHSLRRGIRDPKKWNIACDHATNLLLQQHGFKPYSSDYCDSKYANMTAEQIYDLLPDDCANGDGGAREGDVKDYDAKNNEGKTVSAVEREIGVATAKAAQAAIAAGQFPKGMKQLLEDAQVQKEPWFQHLRRYMTSLTNREFNWNRIHARRAVCLGIISPDIRSEQIGKVVVSIDQSGSISKQQLAAMGAHLTDICNECRPKEVVVIYHDSKVARVDTFEGPFYDIRLERVCGGGTDFRPVFAEIETNHSDARLVLMMTDMYGPMPEYSVHDTLWITPSTEIEAPFGEKIHADFND